MLETPAFSVGPPQPSEVLRDLGFFGRYLHIHTCGRTGKQFVLAVLGKNGGHLTQRELLERSSISSAALSEAVSKLEGESLISRTPNRQDRRQLDIELTDIGWERARSIVRQREDFERSAFMCLSDEELAELSGLLHRLKDHWNSLQESEVSV